MAIDIRLARPGEYDAVDRLVEDSYALDYGPRKGPSTDPNARSARRAEDHDVWVALDGDSGELLGSITTRRPGRPALHEDCHEDEMDVRLLAVSTGARRRGLGTLLTRFVVEHAGLHGYARVFLKSAPHMLPAQRLYDKLGFRRVPERDGLWLGGVRQFDLFSLAEDHGLDGGWVRTRHLQYGLPSPAVFLSAAAQRTSRLELGTAVVPLGFENPFRFAEDLAVADLLAGGRLQIGLSVHPPNLPDEAATLVHGGDWQQADYGYGRIERLLSFLRGERVSDFAGFREFEQFSERVEPHSPTLAGRIWYGAGSLRSARWAGEQGLKLLVSNITTGEGTDVFAEAQRRQIDLFRAHHPAGDQAVVSQGHVVVPTNDATAEQRARFTDYVVRRTPRTLQPGENRRLVAKDLLGSTEQIVKELSDDLAFQGVDEFLFELPFVFDFEDYRHIVRQMAERIGPALGWEAGRSTP